MIIKKNLLEKLKKAKCILFDMDGIITDTMPRHCDSWITSFKNFFNIDVTREEIYKREGEKSEKSVKEILIKYKVENIDDKIIKDFLGYKCKMFNNLGDMPLFDGILDALIFLKRNKKLLGLVTG
ncbi:MAG: HAD hydrolase, family IA, variant 3, partial [uncultured bacterium]